MLYKEQLKRFKSMEVEKLDRKKELDPLERSWKIAVVKI